MRSRTHLTSPETMWLRTVWPGAVWLMAVWLGTLWLGSWLTVAPLRAQYNPPGSSVGSSDILEEESLRESTEEARLRLGVLRLQPWIGVRDASVVTSSEDDEGDLTVSVGAGLRAYLKTGTRLIWAAHALPEYVWWQDDEDKRRLNGRYGLGVFGYFNRLAFEASLRRNETQSFFSPEVQELTTTRRHLARFGVELELTKSFVLYGTYNHAESESVEQESSLFPLLDQEDEATGIGLRYRSPKGFQIGAGLADSTTDFDPQARNLSNTGTSGIFDVGYEGTRFSSTLRLEVQSLEGRPGSDFEDLDVTTGFLETTWQAHRSVNLFVYGRRQIGFSLRSTNSNYLSERIGSRIDLNLRGTALSVAAEIGQDDFRSLGEGVPQQLDDVLGLGMTLSFDLFKVFRFNLGLTHTDYDSSLDELDRDVTAWTATVQLLRDSGQLGQSGKIW